MEDNQSLSFFGKIRRTISAFGATERLVFGILVAIFVISVLIILNTISQEYMTNVPVNGGTFEEGIIGYASYINPVLAYTDADKDMSALIYSGLMKATPTGLAPDLAQSVTVSPDGLTYDVILKNNLKFQDGTPLTAGDVIFTIQKVVDPTIDSPKAADWAGVNVQEVSTQEITFTLPKPYAGFEENLTLGILPSHIWKNIDPALFSHSTYNQEPIGSGPYKLKEADKNSSGIYEYYDLVPFDKYALGEAHVGNLILRFYTDEASAVGAVNKGLISAVGGISPENAAALAAKGHTIKSIPLPRTIAVFFNQSNNPVLLNSEVRQALNTAVDRNAIINQVLKGYGVPATGPIPQSLLDSGVITDFGTSTASTTNGIAAAQAILAAKGWKANSDGVLQKTTTSGKTSSVQTLSFTLTTSNVPELKSVADMLADEWKAIGADVTVQIYEPADLNQNVIKTRKYDALLFGNVVGRDVDLYPFWDSSQRNYPGLNIAEYVNIKADKDLEDARSTASSTVRDADNADFSLQVQKDIPAVFLYSPQYIYVVPKALQGATINDIVSPSERFMSVNQWYVETERIWNIFAKKG